MNARHRVEATRRAGILAVLAMPMLSLAAADRCAAAQPAREVVTNSIGMKLVRIPAGEFDMGSDETEQHLADVGMPLREEGKLDELGASRHGHVDQGRAAAGLPISGRQRQLD